MSLEGGDGGESSNVSRQVIPRLWSCDRKGSVESQPVPHYRYHSHNIS